MEEKYLPIGTVVMLKEGTKRTMIIGYYVVSEDGKKFDYAACLYPEGVLSSDKTLLFNHDQIEKVYAKGYVDEEQQEFMKTLNGLIAEKEGNTITMPTIKENVQPSVPISTPTPSVPPVQPNHVIQNINVN